MKMNPNIKITFTRPDGNPDVEFVSDLWSLCRETRDSLPRYESLKNVKVFVDDVEVSK